MAFIRIWETAFIQLDKERVSFASSPTNCRYGHQHNEDMKHFHHPKQFPHVPLQTISCPLLWPDLLPPLDQFCLVQKFIKMEYNKYSFVLASFTQHNVLKIHPCCISIVCPFTLLKSIPLREYHNLLIHLVGGYLGLFQFGAISEAAVNIHVQVSLRTCFHFSWVKLYQRNCWVHFKAYVPLYRKVPIVF